MNSKIKAELFGSLGIESAEAMAEAELANVTEDDLDQDEVEGETSVAEAIEDTDAVAAVDAIDEQGDDLDNVVEDLDELDVATENFRAKGGKLNPIEAVALKATLGRIVGKYIAKGSDLVPATETFHGDDAGEQTRLAHEGIKESATAFKDGVVAAAKKALETLKKILQNFLDRFRGIESRANKVIVAAKAVKGDLSGTVAINKASVSVGGDASYAAIKNGFGAMNTTLEKLKDAKRIAQFDEIIKEVNEKEDVSLKDIIEHQNKFIVASFNDLNPGATEVEGGLQSKPWPGEYALRLEKPEGGAPLYYEAVIRTKPKEKGGDASVEVLQPDEIISVATAVKATQIIVADYKGFPKRLVAMIERLNTIVVQDQEKIQKASENLQKDKKAAKEVRSSIWRAMTKQMTFYSKLVSAVNDVSGNMLTLCEKSLSAKAGEEKKEEQPKEEPKTEEPKEEPKAE